jgi:hypothetical protein
VIDALASQPSTKENTMNMTGDEWYGAGLLAFLIFILICAAVAAVSAIRTI